MVDPTFKLAYLQELKPWRQRREMQQREKRRDDARRAQAAAEMRKLEERQADAHEQAAQKEQKRAAAAAHHREARERRKFHEALDRTLAQLDRREERVAQKNFALDELVTDVKSWFQGAQRGCLGWNERRYDR